MGIEGIVKDLFNLEINLIESRDITGRKMESPGIGMAQIANKYAVYLTAPLFRPCLADPLPAPEDGSERVAASYVGLLTTIVGQSDGDYTRRTFEDLADLADHVVRRGDFDRHAEALGVVVRIRGVSQQLRFLAKKWGDEKFIGTEPELTTADRLQIRKAWEVGTNVLVMQTVTQLDGDIVTRVSSDRLASPGRRPARDGTDQPPSDQDILFELHRQLIDTGMTNWRHLFRTVAELTGKALSSIVRR